jgi:hypothetical protein
VSELDHSAILWAERCLRRVPLRYLSGVDRRDWDLVRSCFADDAFVKGSRNTAPLDEYLPPLFAGVEYYPVTMHFAGTQTVEVNDDGRSGHVDTYAIAFHWRGDAPGEEHPENLVMGVRYHDDIAEIDGEWRITLRSVDPDWRRGPYPPVG